jgi:hypothetical protein
MNPKDPVLKKANINLRPSKAPNANYEVLTLTGGKGTFLWTAAATEAVAGGKSQSTFRRANVNGQSVQFWDVETFKRDAKIEVTVHRGVKEKTISFKFVDIPLPAAALKPTEQELKRRFRP